MHVVSPVASSVSDGLPRPLGRWWTPLWVLAVMALWWITIDLAAAEATRGRAADLPRDVVRLGVAVSVLCKVLGSTAEASFYSAWWRLRGCWIPYGTLWVWLFSLSVLDMFAMLVPLLSSDAPEVVRVAVAAVCGVRALVPAGANASNAVIALGPLGLLTVARIAMTAWLQARAAGRRFIGPLVLTGSVWLALRVATWWLSDLIRGQSAALGG